MGLADQYAKKYQQYQELCKAAAQGDTGAKESKGKFFAQELRPMEREAARDGVILQCGKNVTAERIDANNGAEPVPLKDLQREYTRKFDAEVTAMLPDPTQGGPMRKREQKEQTLREYHKKRLRL